MATRKAMPNVAYTRNLSYHWETRATSCCWL